MSVRMRPITLEDQAWIVRKLTESWGAPLVISRGESKDARTLPGFVAIQNDKPVGLLTYHIEGQKCEIVTLDSWLENIGVGSNLINAIKSRVLQAGCSRLWLITTNDNLIALKFYQKRGFQLIAVHPDALAESRKIKQSIPQF